MGERAVQREALKLTECTNFNDGYGGSFQINNNNNKLFDHLNLASCTSKFIVNMKKLFPIFLF